MVTHEIPNILHHSPDHGPILVVLQGIRLVGTWSSGKNKHILNFSKNPAPTTSTIKSSSAIDYKHQQIHSLQKNKPSHK
jgi:hypothetical protein